MMTLTLILAAWAIGSTLFVVALANAARDQVLSVQTIRTQGKANTAEYVLKRLHLMRHAPFDLHSGEIFFDNQAARQIDS